MNNPEFNSIINKVKQKDLSPIYLLMGEEPYYIDEISDHIEKSILTEEEQGFNQSVLYGRDLDVGQLISSAKSYPMGADHQVIIVKEAQQMKDLDKLESYFAQPQPTTILVLCHKYKKFDKRKSAFKTLQKTGVIFESKKLYDNQVPDWIIALAKQKGHPISAKAAVLLSEFLGNDLSKIANEMEKLFLNINEGSEIDTEIIEKNIGISKDYNNFELQHALSARDSLKCYQIAQYFGSNSKNHPLVVTLIVLYNFFSQVMAYHFIPDKSQKNVARILKVNPFFVKGYETASRNYSTKQLSKIIHHIKEADLKTKGVNNTTTTDGDLLKELIYKVLN